MIKVDISPLTPVSHKVHIKIKFPTNTATTKVYIPLWRPGRYERADFALNITKIRTYFDDENDTCHNEKIKSHCWLVDNEGRESFTFSYDYYANKMDAGNSVYNEDQLYFNFISCIAFIPELMELPIEVTIHKPEQLSAVCPLTITDNTITASSYHQLVDSPYLASKTLKQLTYNVDQYNY